MGRGAQHPLDCAIIHGDANGIVPVAGARRLHKGIPNSELRILPGAQHALMGSLVQTGLMRPNDEAIRAILDFLIGVDKKR